MSLGRLTLPAGGLRGSWCENGEAYCVEDAGVDAAPGSGLIVTADCKSIVSDQDTHTE